jgi:hypothetical protein
MNSNIIGIILSNLKNLTNYIKNKSLLEILLNVRHINDYAILFNQSDTYILNAKLKTINKPAELNPNNYKTFVINHSVNFKNLIVARNNEVFFYDMITGTIEKQKEFPYGYIWEILMLSNSGFLAFKFEKRISILDYSLNLIRSIDIKDKDCLISRCDNQIIVYSLDNRKITFYDFLENQKLFTYCAKAKLSQLVDAHYGLVVAYDNNHMLYFINSKTRNCESTFTLNCPLGNIISTGKGERKLICTDGSCVRVINFQKKITKQIVETFNITNIDSFVTMSDTKLVACNNALGFDFFHSKKNVLQNNKFSKKLSLFFKAPYFKNKYNPTRPFSYITDIVKLNNEKLLISYNNDVYHYNYIIDKIVTKYIIKIGVSVKKLYKLDLNLFLIHDDDNLSLSLYNSNKTEPIAFKTVEFTKIYFAELIETRNAIIGLATYKSIHICNAHTLEVIHAYDLNNTDVITMKKNELFKMESNCYNLIEFSSGTVLATFERKFCTENQILLIDDGNVLISGTQLNTKKQLNVRKNAIVRIFKFDYEPIQIMIKSAYELWLISHDKTTTYLEEWSLQTGKRMRILKFFNYLGYCYYRLIN